MLCLCATKSWLQSKTLLSIGRDARTCKPGAFELSSLISIHPDFDFIAVSDKWLHSLILSHIHCATSHSALSHLDIPTHILQEVTSPQLTIYVLGNYDAVGGIFSCVTVEGHPLNTFDHLPISFT